MTLRIENLSKKYEDVLVLNDISFEVEKGEIFCLYGVLNVGKSVLIRTIAGNEKFDGGRIIFDDVDLTDCSCDERGFYFPNISNDSYWKTLFKTRNRSELSDGEGQVLAIENIIENALAEGVLLLDNSFCQMDKKTRIKNYNLIKDAVKQRNLAVLFATNDYEEVFQLADKVAILANGKIQQIGTPKEIYEHPVSKKVAEDFGNYNIIQAVRLDSNNPAQPEYSTLAGEHTISTSKTDDGKPGIINQTVSLAIHPEYISISTGASFPEDNLIKAKVTEIKFQGSTTLITLDANGLEIRVLVLRAVGLKVGDEYMVGLPPDRVLVLED